VCCSCRYLDHVLLGDTLSDADNKADLGLDGFQDGLQTKTGQHNDPSSRQEKKITLPAPGGGT